MPFFLSGWRPQGGYNPRFPYPNAHQQQHQGSGGEGRKRKDFSHEAATPFEKKSKHSITNAHDTLISRSNEKVFLGGLGQNASVIYQPINLGPLPSIASDERANRCALNIPGSKAVVQGFEKFANQILSSTFKANKCFSCKFNGGEHDINNKKLFFLGDAHLPPMIGTGTDCVPVLRVQGGAFELLKSVLLAQKEKGFKPKPGSIFAPSVQSYLGRVGASMFLEKLEEFSTWCQETFEADVMPFIMPWSIEVPNEYCSNVSRFLVAQRAVHMGDFKGSKDWKFSLWSPLNEYMKAENVTPRHLVLGSICLRDDAETMLECGDHAWDGLHGDFSRVYPAEIERGFLPMILKTIQENAPPSKQIEIPSNESLELGFKGGLAVQNANSAEIPPPLC